MHRIVFWCFFASEHESSHIITYPHSWHFPLDRKTNINKPSIELEQTKTIHHPQSVYKWPKNPMAMACHGRADRSPPVSLHGSPPQRSSHSVASSNFRICSWSLRCSSANISGSRSSSPSWPIPRKAPRGHQQNQDFGGNWRIKP